MIIIHVAYLAGVPVFLLNCSYQTVSQSYQDTYKLLTNCRSIMQEIQTPFTRYRIRVVTTEYRECTVGPLN